ncbi:hypothetical protein E2320_016254 [Naja naja]|nr:hypothetical protein E2320_016254 [Naja naja]
MDVISGNNISDQMVHNGAIQVDIEDKKYRFTLMCHTEITNCYPVLVNIISNAFLHMLNSTARLRIWSQMFLGSQIQRQRTIGKEILHENFLFHFLEIQIFEVLILLPAFPPQFAMMSMQDYKIKAHSQLRISGLFPSVYWCGQALIDVPLHFAILVLTLLPWLLKLIVATKKLNLLHLLLVSVVSTAIFTIFVSHLIYLLDILIPTVLPYFDSDEGNILYMDEIWIHVLMPYIHSIIFIFLLRYLVLKCDRPVMRRDPVFRISPQRKRIHQNPEELSEENDKDILDERARAQSALASANEEEQKRKLATKNVSFCVKKGEILGLLGPNGAGKSTTISMIMGDVDPTAGQVQIKGATTEENVALGYCPQENPLWSNLTMKEHLEIFAAVTGIRKDDATMAINRIARILVLEEHLKKKTKTLSAGLSRKLCFALSMLSNPTVWLLDEPTTGLDPKGKHQVWRAIHSMLQNKDEGAILTTHHMEEAEAVCDRVAIMVSGQLRCLGSIQYLKSKFGKNYLLQIKVRGVEQGDLVNTQILKMFPQAARQERISTLLVYKIPMEDALPLSKAFSMLEKVKQLFNLEEYSFSLNTLEQVFLELCKEQERDYFDLAPNTTFDWKKLQEGESPVVNLTMGEKHLEIYADMKGKMLDAAPMAMNWYGQKYPFNHEIPTIRYFIAFLYDALLQCHAVIFFYISCVNTDENFKENCSALLRGKYGRRENKSTKVSLIPFLHFFFKLFKLYHADRVCAKKKLVSTDCCTLVEKYNSEMEDENAEFPGKCQATTFTSEWFSSLVLFGVILLTAFMLYHEETEIPHAFLGKSSLNISEVKLLFAPNTEMSREIMKKIEMLSPLKGINMKVVEDEKAMEHEKAMMASAQEFYLDIIGVVFQDEISYRLRFPSYRTIRVSTFPQFIVKIRGIGLKALSHCNLASTAHLLKITKHSVWEEMTSINGIRMKSPSVTVGSELSSSMFLWTLSLCFAPFMYFLALTLSREKRKLKEVMKTMGLRDAAFWLSWGLLYTIYISIPSMVLTFCLKATYFYLSSNSILFVLLFLYGISSICLCFMLSSLLKKPRITSFVIFIFIFCLGALNITTTIRLIPLGLELILSIFCPFAFGAGLSKVLYFQKYGRTFDFTDLMFEPYGYCLLIDSVLYMLLAFYFDKVVPDKYGVPYPPLFFLKKTYWCKPKKPLYW